MKDRGLCGDLKGVVIDVEQVQEPMRHAVRHDHAQGQGDDQRQQSVGDHACQVNFDDRRCAPADCLDDTDLVRLLRDQGRQRIEDQHHAHEQRDQRQYLHHQCHAFHVHAAPMFVGVLIECSANPDALLGQAILNRRGHFFCQRVTVGRDMDQ